MSFWNPNREGPDISDVVVVTIGVLIGFFVVVTCVDPTKDLRKEAVKAGAAEYYVEPGETIAKFRWLPGKPLEKKP